MPYQSQYAGTLADLLLRQGDIAADAQRARGQARGQAIANIGQIAQRGMQGVAEYKADAPRREMQAMQIADAREQRQLRQQTLAENQQIGKLLQASIAVGEDGRPHVDRERFYAGIRDANLGHRTDVFKLVEDADPTPADYTLNPGDTRMRGSQRIATGQPVPPRPPTAASLAADAAGGDPAKALDLLNQPKPTTPAKGSFEDYLSAPPDRRREIETARKGYQQADDRPMPPIVIQTGAGPQLVDRGSGTARGITDQSGGTIGQAPTADMRNKEAARALVGRSIQAIKTLSQKVITKRGVAQRAMAAGRSVESALGNDPEYRTYQDARMALAGNLAVGQQGSRPSDADIRAIWLPLVPDMFRDTDESAVMKWDLIETMSNTAKGSATSAGGPQVGERRTINGQPAEWDGRGWVAKP